MRAIDHSVVSCTFLVLVLVAGCRGHGTPTPAVVPSGASSTEPATTSKPVVAWSQGPLASTRVAPGELIGLVVDAESGAPVAQAQVIVNEWTAGRPLVLTDSAGRFRMPMPNASETLRVRRIGYQPYGTTVPRGDSGVAAVIALRPDVVVLCHVIAGSALVTVDAKGVGHETIQVPRHPGVVVVAHDAFTVRAPQTGITVLVRDSAFRDSISVQRDSGDRIVANAALDRQGLYEVVVRSPGYRDWSGSSATRPTPGCPGEFIPAVFHAWLIPR